MMVMTMVTKGLNKRISETKKCFFCKNAWNVKKHRFIFSHNRKAYICVKCQNALGGKQNVQAILDKIPFNPEKLNYKSADRIKRLQKGAGVLK